MKTISVVYSRLDLLAKQQAAVPGLLVASYNDSAVLKPDIMLQYHTSPTWPSVYCDAVDQVCAAFPSDDVLILEGDIWPIASVPADWPSVVARKWGSKSYPGILFRKAGVTGGRCWENAGLLLPWRFATTDEQSKNGVGNRAEIIGDIFIHVNGSDKPTHCDCGAIQAANKIRGVSSNERGCCGQ